jgi:NAD(P)-dependent dehydrogenase (short-subunit alcohol dehydrogenase family)
MAGASFDSQYPSKLNLREAYMKAYNVNVAGTQIMTTTFVPLLLKSSSPRLIFLTSGLSSLTNAAAKFIPFGASDSGPLFKAGWPKPPVPPTNVAYRSSKTALNMAALGWHAILEADGVKVFTISPGFLATGLGGNTELLKKMGAGPPELGGEIIRAVVEGERDADAGKIVTQKGTQPW